MGHPGRVDGEPLLRSPEITDAEQIARAKNDSWRVGYRGLLPDRMLDGLDDAWSATQWAKWLRHGYENAGLRADIRVATDAAGRVVGVSAYGADRDRPDDVEHGELWVLYVAPPHWGRGFGRALLRDAEDALAAMRRHDLALWVLEGNDRARRFYERAGWREDDGTKLFGDSGVCEVRYRKRAGNTSVTGPTAMDVTAKRRALEREPPPPCNARGLRLVRGRAAARSGAVSRQLLMWNVMVLSVLLVGRMSIVPRAFT